MAGRASAYGMCEFNRIWCAPAPLGRQSRTVSGFGFDLANWFIENADQVDRDLTRYFGGGKSPFTGRWFEEFAPIGDPNRFEPSDVLAVEALSVKVPPEAAA